MPDRAAGLDRKAKARRKNMTRDELFGRLLACVAAVEEGVCARRTRSGLVSLNARTAAPGAPRFWHAGRPAGCFVHYFAVR